MKHSILKSISFSAVMLGLLGILANGCGSGEDFGSGGSGTATEGSGSGTGGSGSAGEAVQEFGIRLGGAKLNELKGVEKISDTQMIVYGNSYSPNLDFNEDGSPDAIGQGNVDGFIASYDISGKFLWGYQLGGSGPDYIHGALKLKDGNILVYGEFGSSSFNADGDPQTHELTASPNSGNVFMATYDPQGNLRWIQRLSANYFDFTGTGSRYAVKKIEGMVMKKTVLAACLQALAGLTAASSAAAPLPASVLALRLAVLGQGGYP